MDQNLELKQKAYEMGKAAKGFHNSTPHSNKEFMAIVPNCAFGDDKGVKLRQQMYKAYIEGWTVANLSNDGEEPTIEGEAHLNKLWNNGKWQ